MKTDTDTIFKYIFWGVAAIVTILFIVIGALLLRIGFDDAITAREKERDERATKYEPWVGEYIVLRHDTLKVTAYSKWRNEFQLEDGAEATPEMVSALMIR